MENKNLPPVLRYCINYLKRRCPPNIDFKYEIYKSAFFYVIYLPDDLFDLLENEIGELLDSIDSNLLIMDKIIIIYPESLKPLPKEN